MLVNYLGLNPIKALVYSAILNGIAAPPLLLLIILLANRRTVMGRFTNSAWSNICGWTCFVLMCAATIAYFVTLFV
jgi:Mn2+/Fe2+ NRAMP family transporter